MGTVGGGGTGAGPDRLVVHLVWEGVLGLIAVVLLISVLATGPDRAFTFVIGQAGAVGLLASAFAFSLRTGTPNLAVGSTAVLTGGISAYLVAENGWGLAVALFVGVVAAVVGGLILGALVGLLSVPAWAASLGVAVVLDAILISLTDTRVIPLRTDTDYSEWVWFGLFVVISIGGAALWWLPAVRDTLSQTRRPGEPATWGGLQPAIGAIAGLTGSSFIAALAGIALLLRTHAAQPGFGQSMALPAIAAVLIGGVSLFGRRAGILGTVLGVLIVASVQNLLVLNGVSSWVSSLLTGLIILIGVGVSRALESVTDLLNRPREQPRGWQ